jgi:hypothetical protein
MRGRGVAISVWAFLVLLVGACSNTVTDGAASNAATRTRAAVANATDDSDSPFKVVSTLTSGDRTTRNVIVFIGDFAADMRADDPLRPSLVTDLKNGSWTDPTSGRQFTLTSVAAWQQEWYRNVLEPRLLNVVDPQARDVLRDIYDPRFEVISESGGWLRLKSLTYDYHVRAGAPLPDGQRERFFKYSRIQAYRRAIANGEPPPLAQLRVDDELAKRRIVPAELRIAVDQKVRSSQLDVLIRVMPLTELESAAIKLP